MLRVLKISDWLKQAQCSHGWSWCTTPRILDGYLLRLVEHYLPVSRLTMSPVFRILPMPSRHEKNVFVNGAVPATTTEYYSVCALEHIGAHDLSVCRDSRSISPIPDEEVDLVIIEMAINDPR